jgi:hypothetical protein
VSNVLNRHTALSGVNESRGCSFTVQGHRQVQLFLNPDFLNDVDGIADKSIFTTLFGDKGVSKHILSHFLYFFGSFDNVNSPLESRHEASKTATSAENLRFDDIARALKLAGYLESLFRCASHISEWDTDLEGVEKCSGLVLVQLQVAHWQRRVNGERSIAKSRGSAHF